MSEIRFPWDPATPPVAAPVAPPEPAPPAKRYGRRPRVEVHNTDTQDQSSGWLYHHLTVHGPAEPVAVFAKAARGAGVIPWQLDFTALEEDVFLLAASQPAGTRNLSVPGCRILARQFRDKVQARQAKAVARIGRDRNCPFDLHTVLPVPAAILRLGPTHPEALAWMSVYWGVSDALRHVVTRPKPTIGRRLASGHAVIGYGFFTMCETPHAAIAQLASKWPALRLTVRPRPAD